MKVDVENFEKTIENGIEKNNKYIKKFQENLIKEGLSYRTINKHVDNIDLFANDFLLYSFEVTVANGITFIDDYLLY